MYYYKYSDKMTAENVKTLMAQAPSQAAAILLAVWELKGNEAPVSEDAIIDHISADLARFSPRAKGPEVVPGFVAYYRAMLGKLPAHIMEQTKDNLGSKPRGGGKRAAESMIDPVTGETIENVFKRAPVKNPGSRKTRKIVTEEILGDDDDSGVVGFEEPADELEDENT
jgi:hypothetical protein